MIYKVRVSVISFLNELELICTLVVLIFGRPGFNPRSRHTKDFKNGT